MTLLYIWLGLELAIVLGAIICRRPEPRGSTDWDRSDLPLLDQIRYRNTTKENYIKLTERD